MDPARSPASAPEIVAVKRDGDGRALLVDDKGRMFAVVARFDGFRRGCCVELVRLAERAAA